MLSQNFTVNANADIVVSGNGVAGTPDAGVVSIQGISGGTPVPVSGTVTAANASVGSTGTTAPTSATEIGGVVSASAPTVTAGNLAPLSLTTSSGLRVDGSGTTQPISAASLPLPTGAATSANQVTELASLASIDAGIPAALGSTTGSASMPVVIASDQVLPLPTGASTSALQTSGNASLVSILGSTSPATSTTTDLTLVATTSTATLALNTARKSFFLFNDSSLATVYVLEASSGATATHWSYKLLPQGSYESPAQCYTGALSYFSTLASGVMHVTERA